MYVDDWEGLCILKRQENFKHSVDREQNGLNIYFLPC